MAANSSRVQPVAKLIQIALQMRDVEPVKKSADKRIGIGNDFFKTEYEQIATLLLKLKKPICFM
jgi:hypothetical protein